MVAVTDTATLDEPAEQPSGDDGVMVLLAVPMSEPSTNQVIVPVFLVPTASDAPARENDNVPVVGCGVGIGVGVVGELS